MGHAILLFLTTFAASAVEAVEALTIVLAVGVVFAESVRREARKSSS